MARLALRRRGLVRAVVALLFAWLLALQGFAAASPCCHFAHENAGQAITHSGNNCGTHHSGNPTAPCHHEHCECCVLCASGHAGGLALIAAIVSGSLVFPAPRARGVNAWRFPGADNKPPSGWTSSWSQRAPPRFS